MVWRIMILSFSERCFPLVQWRLHSLRSKGIYDDLGCFSYTEFGSLVERPNLNKNFYIELLNNGLYLLYILATNRTLTQLSSGTATAAFTEPKCSWMAWQTFTMIVTSGLTGLAKSLNLNAIEILWNILQQRNNNYAIC